MDKHAWQNDWSVTKGLLLDRIWPMGRQLSRSGLSAMSPEYVTCTIGYIYTTAYSKLTQFAGASVMSGQRRRRATQRTKPRDRVANDSLTQFNTALTLKKKTFEAASQVSFIYFYGSCGFKKKKKWFPKWRLGPPRGPWSGSSGSAA